METSCNPWIGHINSHKKRPTKESMGWQGSDLVFGRRGRSFGPFSHMYTFLTLRPVFLCFFFSLHSSDPSLRLESPSLSLFFPAVVHPLAVCIYISTHSWSRILTWAHLCLTLTTQLPFFLKGCCTKSHNKSARPTAPTFLSSFPFPAPFPLHFLLLLPFFLVTFGRLHFAASRTRPLHTEKIATLEPQPH